MTTATNESRRKHVMITDLDVSDSQQQTSNMEQPHRKSHKKRLAEKTLHTISGNFSRRSRSAECRTMELPMEATHAAAVKQSVRVNSYFNELLQSKDKQMEKLLQRLATLHEFNEQFDQQNQKQRTHIQTLEQRVDTLQHQIENCSRCQQLSQQVAKYETDNQELATDVTMLKTLVYRLNVQIERYQDQIRLAKDSKSTTVCSEKDGAGDGPSQSQPQMKSSISQWQQGELRTHTLAPLLQAYDEMICDKEQLIQQYQQEFEHFAGELKRVVEQNNQLLKENETVQLEVSSWREERTRLQAQVDVCRTKAEAQTKKTDLAKEKLVDVMHCYEQKMQSLVLDMEHLQSAYSRCKLDLASLKSLTSQPADSIAHSLQECKELLEELKQQHSKEKQTLEYNITQLTERRAASDDKVDRLKQENTALSKELDKQRAMMEELKERAAAFQRAAERVKRSRDRLKARLRIALQWAQKLEEGQANIQSTWDALKRLETIVKHKESQVRGLHARHLQEIDKMQKKLLQKEETIRTILKGKLGAGE